MKNTFILFLCFPLFLIGQSNQEYNWPSLSPLQTLTQVVGNTTFKVSYERPSKRGRKIFGELVPWNKVWRTGAGNCTKISFDKDVEINSTKVNAGTYSIFTIPNEQEWIVILNRDSTLYGSGRYEKSKDAIRFKVISKNTNRIYEAMTIDLDFIPNNARVYISWDQTQIGFEIRTSTDKEITAFIDKELIGNRNTVADNYARAADYLYMKNEDYDKALRLADMALDKDKNQMWVYRLKVEMLEKMKKYKEALAEVERAFAQAKNGEYQVEKYREEDLVYWKAHRIRIKKMMESKK